MAVNYNPTDPVQNASRATKEVELWTDAGDTFADINSRLSSIEGDAAVLGSGAAADGLVLTTDGAGGSAWEAPAGGGSAIRVEDEGTSTVAAATALNFAGAGVTVTDAGSNEALVTIPGASTPAFSGAKLTKSANQSIPDATFTAVTFNGETYDTASYHDNVTNNSRITIPTTGYYAFTGLVSFTPLAAVANLIGTLYVNGVEVATSRTRWNGVSGSDNNLPVVADLSLTAGQYVELYARHTRGAAMDISSGCSLSCRFLGT